MAQPAARAPDSPPLRVLYFGGYDRGAGRNTIVMEALGAAGVQVVECHHHAWPDTDSKIDAARSMLGTSRAIARHLAAWPRLLLRATSLPADLVLVGATAHADVPPAALLARCRGIPLVFDPLISAAETVRDRGLVGSSSLQLALLTGLERRLYRMAAVVLVDTAAHAAALQAEIGLDPARVVVVPAGAPAAFRAAPAYRPSPAGVLHAVYFGQFIPLHGLHVVAEAAARLRDLDGFHLTLVGRGQDLPAVRRHLGELRLANVTLRDEWLPPSELVERYVTGADVCMGVFGDVPKAHRVVPFKVYAGLAAGRAVVTASTAAAREQLRLGVEVAAVPPGNPEALAACLRELANLPERRLALASAGRAAYESRFAPELVGHRLRLRLEAAVAAHALAATPAPIAWPRPTP